MRRAFLVCGAENAGNKMVTAALVSAGVWGDDGDLQAMDDLDFTGRPDRIVLRRSVPHGVEIPDLLSITRRMRRAGYRVTVLFVVRKSDYLVSGQMRVGYAKTPEHARQNWERAATLAYRLSAHLQQPLVVVPYELFVELPAVRADLFASLGLPPPTCPVWNANASDLYSTPAQPW